MKNTMLTIGLILMSISLLAQSYLVQVKPEGSKTWGYANENGELQLAPVYKKCFAFSEGYGIIQEGKEFVFIKPDGSKLKTELTGFRLAKASFFGYQGFSDGLVQIQKSGKWGFLDTDGQLAIDTKYSYATKFSDGFAVVKRDEVFYVINKRGEESRVELEGVLSVKYFSEGLAPIKMADKTMGFLGVDGKVAINPKYVAVGYFHSELAWVKNADGTLGYIDKNGALTIESKFQACKNFDAKSGMARVKVDGIWAYTNRQGKVLFIKDTDTWGDFNGGLAKGRKNGLFGFFDNTGNWVIEPKFEGVRDFKNGFAAAKLNGKWGMINKAGDWVVEPEYVGIKDFSKI